MEWSKEQQSVIYYKEPKNLLVSAGAGSGKTAVLTERIYQLIKQGASLDDFLVLTFTNLAASEMKSRTQKKLLDDKDLSLLAPLVDASHIETFDAFCLYVVKRFHYYLDLPKEINIIDKSVLDINARIFLREIFDAKYESEDKDLLELISNFCIKDDENIFNLVLKTFQIANLSLDKEHFYKTYVEDTYNEAFVDNLINGYFKETRERILSFNTFSRNGQPNIDFLCDLFDKVESCTCYDELYGLLKKVEPKSIPKKSEKLKELIPDIDELLTTIRDYVNKTNKDEDFGDSKTIKEIHLSNKKYASIVLNITKELDDKILEFKSKQNCYDFSDIAKFTLKILTSTPAKEILKNSFKYIMVDEYQDTSDIQEAVVNAIADNNVFMVGDIKQSIYRFRNANCNIFQEKFDSYKKGIGGNEIDLNKSFRSRREIVDVVNQMFSKLMDKKVGPIDYKNGHNFLFGQEDYEKYKGENQDYDIDIYGYELLNGEKAEFKEAEIIAEDIIRKYNSKYQVFDKDLKCLRDVEFKDFAIIASRGTNFDALKRVFGKRNIPINIIRDVDIKENEILLVTKNLVSFLYYSLNEDYENIEYIHSFISLARSFLFSMKDKDVYTAVKEKKILTQEFVLKLELIKEKLRYLSLKEIVETLYEYYDIESKFYEIGNYKENLMYSEMILKIADSLDLMNNSIKDFIDYFSNLDDFDIKLKASEKTNVENAVTMLNIHKSKGLEFGIVYYFDLGAKMNIEETKGATQATKKFGILLPNIAHKDKTSFVISLFKSDEKRELLLEYVRLFYVALTRAKEKIILIKERKSSKAINSFSKLTKFSLLVDYCDLDHRITNFEDKKTVLGKKEKQLKKIDFQIKKISVSEPQIINRKKASKEVGSSEYSSLLDFGNRMHYLLEIINYETKDLSFVTNKKEVKYLTNVLNLEIFKNIKNDDLLHEYKFYDEINNVHGVIDCIIKKEDSIIIVDFKLKNISDEAYINQLHIYCDYISQISDKPIKMYLVSIIDGVSMEVL